MKIAIVGVTGLVGQTMLKILEERQFPASEIIPVATERSAGRKVNFGNKVYPVVTMAEGLKAAADIALFSAGGSVSREWAPRWAEAGAYVIDNSSAWRMDSSKRLIVPEINGEILTANDKIIANPNCSTIQLLMVLAPLHKKYGLRRAVISTYQSVTGSGNRALQQLEREEESQLGEMIYPHQIHRNCLPHCGNFTDNGYTEEEMKLVNESHKILDDNRLKITATAVRIPVVGGHSEAVNAELNKPFELNDIVTLLENSEGVEVQDDTESNKYPMPLTTHHKDTVFVGRIRRDFSQDNSLNLWIVSDNLRKGAATNAVQIAEIVQKFIKK